MLPRSHRKSSEYVGFSENAEWGYVKHQVVFFDFDIKPGFRFFVCVDASTNG
jgi:hypothetical protein